jgi:cyanophycin synthetase
MNKKYIDIINVMSLRGPNIWTYRPVLEFWVDIGDLEDSPSNTIPGFYDRLTAWLPGLAQHRCGVGEPGGFLLRLQEGTWPGHILEHVMIELQNLAGTQTGFGKARETSQRGVYKVVVRARLEPVSRAALYIARDLVMAAIEDQPYDLAAKIEELKDMVDSLNLGPSTACIVTAATERHIPAIRLNEGNLVQLGYGARQRRIWTAETDQTGAIAESISSDKDLTKSLLQSCGVPIPEGRVVDSPDDAWDAAEDIGGPIVIKPSDGNHGRGVSTNLTSRDQIDAAFQLASNHGSEVLVERFIPGNEHRLLVVGGRLVAAARGETAYVTGNGKASITELVDQQINTDPRRGTTEDFPLNLVNPSNDSAIRLDLVRQGYTPDSIPAEGKEILIQRNGNVALDVTELVHPSTVAIASLAARIVGLDIAGVDLVAEDISRPLAEQRGAIVEVNAGPGLLMHLKPAGGPARPVGRAIIDHLFAEDESGRIPVVGISGSRGKTMVARLVARLLHLHGAYVGLACSDGLFLNQRPLEHGDCATWKSAHRVLLNRMVDAAVFESGNRAILSEGLAYDRCQVGVITNIYPSDLLPEYFIEDEAQIVKVVRTQIDIVLPDGVAVLNASDIRVAEMASLCDGEVIFFALTPDALVLAEHASENGRSVYVRNGSVVLATGSDEVVLSAVSAIRLAANSNESHQLENVLAAIAAAWALGLSTDLIRAGIETLDDGFGPVNVK